MKFLVDQCCQKSVTFTLRRAGYDVVSVDEEMPGSSDSTVLDRSIKEERIIVTEDKDFGEMLFRQHLRSIGIILLRFRASESSLRNNHLLNIVQRYEKELRGNFFVLSKDKTRIRPILQIVS